jgi:putative transposase
MPSYKRAARIRGGTYFFTHITNKRKPLLVNEEARYCLRQALSEVQYEHPFEIDGLCLLPDHLHMIWTLPKGDRDYSQRWAAVKGLFSKKYRSSARSYPQSIGSRLGLGERAFWQRRFWEHLITDEDDFRRHLDYLHYNPVKHGHVASVVDWPWSSFHRYARAGIYPLNWGSSSQIGLNLVTAGE